jgi:hypothetical protein
MLTDAGAREREVVFALQGRVRQQTLQAISDHDYLSVIDVLHRMVHNLEDGITVANRSE